MKKENKLPLSKKNYTMMLISLALILVGLILMSGGANNDPQVFNEAEIYSFRRITLSVIVTLAGFSFMVYAIMYRGKKSEVQE